MATVTFTEPIPTMEDLLDQLGDIPPHRILMQPPPGTATEEDLIAAWEAPQKRLCELVDNVLVEKVIGVTESYLAMRLGRFVGNFMDKHDLGMPFGPDAPFRILLGKVRLPDLSVFDWDSLPNRMVPVEKVPRLVPDLVAEIISEGNTAKEIQRKLREYFLAGVRMVWIIYPKNQSARIHTAPDKYKRIASNQSLTANDILPGFELPLATLFDRVPKNKTRKK